LENLDALLKIVDAQKKPRRVKEEGRMLEIVGEEGTLNWRGGGQGGDGMFRNSKINPPHFISI
jgi:hypothetical protein